MKITTVVVVVLVVWNLMKIVFEVYSQCLMNRRAVARSDGWMDRQRRGVVVDVLLFLLFSLA